MYSDYNESTRRFRNPGRIEDFWDQQGKVVHGEGSCCNFCGSKYVMACWDNQRKEFFHVASVVDDVAAYGRKQQKVEVLVIILIIEA
jgi:hypothetical protein